jgi:ribonuclease HII
LDVPQTAFIKGDALVLSIACASVLAKTCRDGFMRQISLDFPEYGFAQHKGYGTTFHRSALAEHGPCAEHRFSYKPLMPFARL